MASRTSTERPGVERNYDSDRSERSSRYLDEGSRGDFRSRYEADKRDTPSGHYREDEDEE